MSVMCIKPPHPGVDCGAQKTTKAKLGATAGLRLLEGGKADHILAAVKKYLKASPFAIDEETGVSILDGATVAIAITNFEPAGNIPRMPSALKPQGGCILLEQSQSLC